jgi:putative transcriptional regulator
MSDEPIVVTDENFGDLLIQSARDALAHARGDTAKGRVRVRARITDPPTPPPTYDADAIRSLRMRLGLSQRAFAGALNVSDKTVKAWEQGVNTPSGPALRLLQIVESRPEAFGAVLGQAVHVA